MGKRIIQQRRGKGSITYRVRRKAFKYKIKYPSEDGKGKVIKLIDSGGHTAPLAKIKINEDIFYNPAFNEMVEGQEIEIGGNEVKEGNVLALKNIPQGISVYNIEVNPGDGGRLIRSGGSSAIVTKKLDKKIAVLLPSKKEKWFNENARATIGIIAGHGRKEKPIMKAGRKFHLMRARGKLWPRTSAVKMNVIDHPFGSGRGKRVAHGKKGKTPKRNSPPGAKVGSLRPKRTGKKR
tara:strand:- start:78 stop:785 length:708 start_codon:yes stop_codon:yes gene_type:complete